MKRTKIQVDPGQFPDCCRAFLEGAAVYDSSCSPEARVYFSEKEGGVYLKTAPQGTLRREAEMNGFFHSKGLGPEVLLYESLEKDWLVTRQIPGEDCTHGQYLSDPKRLCETTALLLRQLHETEIEGCPVENRTQEYLETARRNHAAGRYDPSLFPDNWGFCSAQEAWQELEQNGRFLRSDTLLHGDYCLPNIILRDWRFSGFIDLGSGGVGERHVDLFWGAWTLNFNLKTDAYRERFLDAYGRDRVEEALLRTVAAAEVFG